MYKMNKQYYCIVCQQELRVLLTLRVRSSQKGQQEHSPQEHKSVFCILGFEKAPKLFFSRFSTDAEIFILILCLLSIIHIIKSGLFIRELSNSYKLIYFLWFYLLLSTFLLWALTHRVILMSLIVIFGNHWPFSDYAIPPQKHGHFSTSHLRSLYPTKWFPRCK